MDKNIAIKSYSNKMEAELAKNLLSENNIVSEVDYPISEAGQLLGLVKLRVNENDAQKAMEILNVLTESTNSEI